MEIINANTKMFKNDFVWSKTRLTNSFYARHGINRSHENILMFYDKKPIYNLLKYHTKESSLKNGKARVSSKDYETLEPFTTNIYTPRLPLSVMEYNPATPKTSIHRTQKPISILETLIKYYSDDDAVVLDPTMGSGSTGEASHNLGRKFIGIELDKTIYDVAVKRLEELNK